MHIQNSGRPPTIEEMFISKITKIFNGRLIVDNNIQPVETFNPEQHVYVGLLMDYVPRQLYAYRRSLNDRMKELAKPAENPQELGTFDYREHDHTVAVLREQITITTMLFWQSVRAYVPECSVLDEQFLVCKDWEVAYHKH